MLASDIDGTLLDYNYTGTGRVNASLIERWKQAGITEIALVSNQGGLAFGVDGVKRADGRAYPTPQLCADRLARLVATLATARIMVAEVRYCLYHEKARAEAIRRAATELRARLLDVFPGAVIYESAQARKPSPLMLRSVGATVYYGDSDEDEGAARAAGIPFVRVLRFE